MGTSPSLLAAGSAALRSEGLMAAPRRTRAKAKAIDPAVLASRTPSQVLADEIIAAYGDLAPSVNRIMSTEGLEEDGRMHAISLFRDSLQTPGDPMRHPTKAAEAGLAFQAAQG